MELFSPVCGVRLISVILQRASHRFHQLGASVVHSVDHWLQLVSVPLGLVSNQRWVVHVYKSRVKLQRRHHSTWIFLPKRDLLLCILWKARLEGLRAHSPKNSTAWVWDSLSAKLERRGRDARNDDDRKATTGRGKRRSVRVWIWNPWRTFEELKNRTMATLDKRGEKKKLISLMQIEFFRQKEPKEQINLIYSK